MFTGIIETLGRIAACRPQSDAVEFEIEAPDIASELVVGQSVATDGVCLTVTRADARRFAVTAVAETLRRSTLGQRQVGDQVNLERAMQVGGRLDGHLVQGHVDGVATVRKIRDAGPGWEVAVELPDDLRRFVAFKGSITVDGVSLTIARLDDDAFWLALVPHTLSVTTLGGWSPGRRVNLEVDVLARYLDRMLEVRGSSGQADDTRRDQFAAKRWVGDA